ITSLEHQLINCFSYLHPDLIISDLFSDYARITSYNVCYTKLLRLVDGLIKTRRAEAKHEQ
ncbi:hypothetical protein, partial [Candidatus Paracaedibacter symbiosus]|uniref:hypothetical protein n=1 Tax=Candidatus Paracaedibacter symbiosus TaxID=244582 RepID=UPI001E42DE09